MVGIRSTMLVTGLCVALAAGAACAEDSPFAGKCAALRRAGAQGCGGGGGGHGR